MKTSKPFSTISYNSEEYLIRKLNELVLRRNLEFWCFVHHYAEEDELKVHKHLFIVPNGQVNTDQISEYLLEPDPPNPKPLGCIRFRSSNFTDWFLYSSHNEAYLLSKGQFRRYKYALNDFKTSDLDYLQEEIHLIDYSKLNRFNALREAIDNGETFTELIKTGSIPIQQIGSYERAYTLLVQDKVNRANRTTHTPIENDTE